MGRPPSSIWQHAVNKEAKNKNYSFACLYCETTFRGSATVLTDHLTGQGRKRSPCKLVPENIAKCLKTEEMNKTIQDQNQKRHLQMVQTTISRGGRIDEEDGFRGVINSGDSSDEERVIETDGSFSDEEVRQSLGITQLVQRRDQSTRLQKLQAEAEKFAGQYFYAHGVPHTHAKSPSFVKMCKAINKMPSGTFEVPSPYRIKRTVLMANNEVLKNTVDHVMKGFKKYGCTIASDGWTNRVEMPIVIATAVSEGTAVFLDSQPSRKNKKSRKFIADFVETAIESVGSENVLQVVLDSASAIEKAAEALEQKFPNIFFNHCAVYGVDLMIEEVAKLDFVQITIEKCSRLVNFLTIHSFTRSYARQLEEKIALKLAATRFATKYIMIERLLDINKALKSMVITEDWETWPVATTRTGSEMKAMILSAEFWNECQNIKACFEPVFVLINKVGGHESNLGDVFVSMENCMTDCSKLEQIIGRNSAARIRGIVSNRWWDKMRNPLHDIAALLNPKWLDFVFPYKLVMESWNEFLKKRVPENEWTIMTDELFEFRQKKSDVFSWEPVIHILEKVKKGEATPAKWWYHWGGYTPHLQKYALMLLSQCSSASSCKRNWSTYNLIRSKRKNQMNIEKICDLDNCNFNLKLVKPIFMKAQSTKEIAKDDEPMVNCYDKGDWFDDESFRDSSGWDTENEKSSSTDDQMCNANTSSNDESFLCAHTFNKNKERGVGSKKREAIDVGGVSSSHEEIVGEGIKKGEGVHLSQEETNL